MRNACLILCASLLAAPSAGRAACTISTFGLSFGQYDPLATSARDTTSTVSYNCQGTSSAWATLSRGSSGRLVNRSMARGSDRLSYNVYLDPNRTRVWGDFSSGGYFIIVPGGQGGFPVYGRIFAQQDVSPGVYADSLVVTFYF